MHYSGTRQATQARIADFFLYVARMLPMNTPAEHKELRKEVKKEVQRNREDTAYLLCFMVGFGDFPLQEPGFLLCERQLRAADD